MWVWLLAVGIVGIFLVHAQSQATGAAPSNVTVQAQIAIALSTNFTDGLFNTTLDTNTNNNQDPGMGGGALGTVNAGNNVTVTDSNTNVALCINQNTNLTLKTETTKFIPRSNYTWHSHSNSSNLSVGFSTTFVDDPSYTAVNSSVPNGSVLYFGFWVDIPSAQTAGEYNNTINILARRSAVGCP